MSSELERLLLRVDTLSRGNQWLQEKNKEKDKEIEQLKQATNQKFDEMNQIILQQAKEIKELRAELRQFKNENTPSGAIPVYLKEELQKSVQEPKESKEPKSNPRNARATPDRVEKHILLACPDCGGDLTEKKRKCRRTVSHLVPPRVENVGHEYHPYYCKNCKKEVVPKIPNTLPNCKFDLTTAIFISYLSVASNNSMGTIKRTFFDVIETKISKGTVSNTLTRLKDYLGDEYAFLEKEVKEANARYRDETGWRKNGKTFWDWVVATTGAVIYRLEKSRCHENALKIKGNRGADVSDAYRAYNRLEGPKQRCWSHLLRVAKEPEHPFAIDQEIEDYKKLVARLGRIFHNSKEELKLAGQSADLRKKYEKLLLECLQAVRWHGNNSNKLVNYIMHLEGEWFTFLEYPDVDPTNNRAERALRHIVLKRRISQQSRGEKSMESYAMQASLFMTARQKDENYMEYLRHVVEEKLNDDGKS